ncbi:MAG: DUF4434 domain-containing protein, partial [Kiritimatiellae bacterium]|nr:DUF4434 domain-containing protein [Kiritimatiellia bacterium]
RAMHDQVPRIALWGNVESFTWEVGGERAGTERWLPLVPAAFPRLLSQMAAVTPHVDEVVCYAVLGTMDKPGSPVPVGQPALSARLAEHYLDFIAGRGRWPLLAASFRGALTHDALDKPVTVVTRPVIGHEFRLTDGGFGDEDAGDHRHWVGFDSTDLKATIDLGQTMPVHVLAARFLQYERQGIRLPSRVEFALSNDGQDFQTVASVDLERWPHDRQDYWIDMAVTGELNRTARYVRVHAANAANWLPGNWLFVDELLVNPRMVE